MLDEKGFWREKPHEENLRVFSSDAEENLRVFSSHILPF